jgi:glycosyltransferase involved in cell wall biosynthesis
MNSIFKKLLNTTPPPPIEYHGVLNQNNGLETRLVSIIILTYNAPQYVRTTLESLATTQGVEYEVIVLDNASDFETQELLWELKKKGLIDKLIFENENTFFAKGNNLAFSFCNENSKYVLFLNSDVEIVSSSWLSEMLKLHTRGATSYGLAVSIEGRDFADGYCILFDKELYNKHKLDEKYQWFYAMAKTEALLLKDGYDVKAVKDHDHLLRHFGGKSGDAFKNAKNTDGLDYLYDKWLSKCKKKAIPIFADNVEIGTELSSCYIMRGIYKDGWCMPLVDFKIKTGEKGIIKIDCWSLRIDNKHNAINISINGKYVKKAKMQLESFSIEFFAPKNQIVTVTIRNDYYFKADLPDRRNLCYIISNIKSS